VRPPAEPRIEIDGEPASPARLGAIVLGGGYGHFTAMQVRDGRTRGLHLHLSRLDAASREMFGTGLDGGHVRGLIRHALRPDVADASVRVIVQRPREQEPPWVTVTVRPPGGPLPSSRLQSVPYQRSMAHIKHLGDFGQGYYGRLAETNGFDEALLTGPDGLISEGSITNIGFFDGETVVWPAAPMLAGITMQLVASGLGFAQARRPVRLAELSSFASVFITNSHGVATVTSVDSRELAVDREFAAAVADCYESVVPDLI
jgi:branched-subunit amino acid aminotransferase/4-amino-4-deoxychorismate lyase